MAFSLLCPECGSVLRSSAEVPAGKKVKCPKCAATFLVGGGSTSSLADENLDDLDEDCPPRRRRRDEPEEDDHEPRRRKKRPDIDNEEEGDVHDDDCPRKPKRRRDDDEGAEDDRPRKRGKKKKKYASKGLKIGVLVGGGVLAVGLVIVPIVVFGLKARTGPGQPAAGLVPWTNVDPDLVGDWGPFHFSRAGTLTSREHPGESLRYSCSSPGKLRIENGVLFDQEGVITIDYSISPDKQSLTLRPSPNRSITFGRTKITRS